MLELCLIDLIKDPLHVYRNTHLVKGKTRFLHEEHEGLKNVEGQHYRVHQSSPSSIIVFCKFRFFFISTYRILYHHHHL